MGARPPLRRLLRVRLAERARVLDGAAVIAATGGDPYARNTLPERGWQLGETVGWLGLDAEERIPYLSVLGPPGGLLGELPHGIPLTLTERALGQPAFHWHFLAIEAPPPEPDIEVRVLPGAGDERIAALLARTSETPSVVPGDTGVNRWITVRDEHGLIACAADTSRAPGVGHMGSVAVEHRARGRGVAQRMVAWLTRDLLRSGRDVVVCGVFVSELAARRLYERVGFRVHHELFSYSPSWAATISSSSTPR